MVSISRSALVDYSAKQMFDLVNDIESYPQFMTDCLAAELIVKNDQFIEARLTLGKSGFQQVFVTRNELKVPESMIMRLIEGPFRFFEGYWRFTALTESACKVSLDLEFEFSNPIIAITVGKHFKKLTSEQVNALCQRASEIY